MGVSVLCLVNVLGNRLRVPSALDHLRLALVVHELTHQSTVVRALHVRLERVGEVLLQEIVGDKPDAEDAPGDEEHAPSARDGAHQPQRAHVRIVRDEVTPPRAQ